MKKAMFVANVGFTLTNFRSELMQKFRDNGYVVKIVCPTESDFNSNLLKYEKDVIPIFLSRRGLSPLKDLKTFFQLIKIYREEKPDVILNYTIKPTIYSSIAAHICGVKQIFSTITGLGYIFTGDSLKKKLIRLIVCSQYRLALRYNKKVFFQNPDDLELYTKLGLVEKTKAKIINGSGVNLNVFQPDPNVIKIPKSFLFIGRILKDKGIGELIEAAKVVKNTYPDTKICLLGNLDENPASYKLKDIEKWKSEGLVDYLPPIEDVRSILKSYQVFVLPSYREGTPRSILEALAMGMPVITTDVPGCRETVQNGENGFLVPVKNSYELAQKMIYFIENPEVIEVMGAKGLQIAYLKYDVHSVNKSIYSEVDTI